jgi:hypothetical protein
VAVGDANTFAAVAHGTFWHVPPLMMSVSTTALGSTADVTSTWSKLHNSGNS